MLHILLNAEFCHNNHLKYLENLEKLQTPLYVLILVSFKKTLKSGGSKFNASVIIRFGWYAYESQRL